MVGGLEIWEDVGGVGDSWVRIFQLHNGKIMILL